VCEASGDEVEDLRAESRELRKCAAEITLGNRVLKESLVPSRSLARISRPESWPIATASGITIRLTN